MEELDGHHLGIDPISLDNSKHDHNIDVKIHESKGLTDCTVSSAINKNVARLQEDARRKNDILKVLKWPSEAVM